MEIKKADSKGRVSGFEPDRHYFITGPMEGSYRVREVPIGDTVPEGYEPAEVADLKNSVMDALYAAGLDDEAHDMIELADKVGESLSQTVFKVQ